MAWYLEYTTTKESVKKKNMKRLNFLWIAMIAITFASCAKKIPFTTAVQTKYKLGDQEVKSLQFYLAGDITIYNGNRDGSTQTDGGELVITDEQNMNKLFFPNGTRGIVEQSADGLLHVSFEEGKELLFKASERDGKYRVKPEKIGAGNRGVVKYGGEEYFLSATSMRSYLVFKLKNSTKRRSTQKTIKGRKL